MVRVLRAVAGLVAIGIAVTLAAEAEAQTTKPSPVGGGSEAVIYRDRNYAGPAVSVSRVRPDLGLAWQVGSIRIERGAWELCSRPNFEGRCTQYDKSRASLPASQRTVQSMRPVYESGWELVRERDVRDRTDRDTIISWGHTKHRRLRICVEGHAVRFYDVGVVVFFTGRQDVPVRALIGAGQCTRDIDFNGAHDISLVNLKYETFSLGHGTATVQVYAQR